MKDRPCRVPGRLGCLAACAGMTLSSLVALPSSPSLAQTGNAALQKSPIPLPPQLLLPASLNLQRWNGLPISTASLNASLLERLVIDTGLNANVLLPDAAVRLGLTPGASRVRVNVMDVSVEAPETTVVSLRSGSIEIKNISFALAHIPQMLSVRPRPDAPSGWLGTPFLSAFQVSFAAEMMSVRLEKAQAPFPRNKDMTIVPLVMRDGRPYVKISLPGTKPFLALVDTGSPGTVIPAEIAEKLKLKPIKVETISRPLSPGQKSEPRGTEKPGEKTDKKEPALPAASVGGAGQSAEATPPERQGKVALAELPRLTLGKCEWKNARVVYLLPESDKVFDRTFAVLGMDFLSRFNVSLNYSRQQLALSPPAPVKEDETVK